MKGLEIPGTSVFHLDSLRSPAGDAEDASSNPNQRQPRRRKTQKARHQTNPYPPRCQDQPEPDPSIEAEGNPPLVGGSRANDHHDIPLPVIRNFLHVSDHQLDPSIEAEGDLPLAGGSNDILNFLPVSAAAQPSYYNLFEDDPSMSQGGQSLAPLLVMPQHPTNTIQVPLEIHPAVLPPAISVQIWSWLCELFVKDELLRAEHWQLVGNTTNFADEAFFDAGDYSEHFYFHKATILSIAKEAVAWVFDVHFRTDLTNVVKQLPSTFIAADWMKFFDLLIHSAIDKDMWECVKLRFQNEENSYIFTPILDSEFGDTADSVFTLNVPPDKVVLHFSNAGLQALVLRILRRFPRFVVDSLTFKVFLTPVRLLLDHYLEFGWFTPSPRKDILANERMDHLTQQLQHLDKSTDEHLSILWLIDNLQTMDAHLRTENESTIITSANFYKQHHFGLQILQGTGHPSHGASGSSR